MVEDQIISSNLHWTNLGSLMRFSDSNDVKVEILDYQKNSLPFHLSNKEKLGEPFHCIQTPQTSSWTHVPKVERVLNQLFEHVSLFIESSWISGMQTWLSNLTW